LAGFTLIELLIVVVLIGVLAMVAIPRYSNTRQKAYRAQMQSELRNLVSAQETYFNEHYDYATNISNLDITRTPNITIELTDVKTSGWSAKATHASSPEECGIYVGAGTPPAGIPLPTEGGVGCTRA
jgi:prepilin-type N-terminal cleavage/methylation domain-containing protein